MSGGVSASTVALGMLAAGTAMATSAAYNKSKADKAAYEYQSQVAKNNAQLAEWQAQDATMRGQTAEGVQRSKTAQLKGAQRASLAARGLALDEGSPLDILTTTDYMGERDALTIRDNASREAWALREQGKGNTANASLLAARAGAENPLMSGATTFLTSGGSVASSWYGMRGAGGGGTTNVIPGGVGAQPY